jgi:hypothetical protein
VTGQFELPPEVDPFRIAATRRWIAVDGRDSSVYLLERETGQVRRFDAPDDGRGDGWSFGFSPDGRELLALSEGRQKLYRFALP